MSGLGRPKYQILRILHGTIGAERAVVQEVRKTKAAAPVTITCARAEATTDYPLTNLRKSLRSSSVLRKCHVRGIISETMRADVRRRLETGYAFSMGVKQENNL